MRQEDYDRRQDFEPAAENLPDGPDPDPADYCAEHGEIEDRAEGCLACEWGER